MSLNSNILFALSGQKPSNLNMADATTNLRARFRMPNANLQRDTVSIAKAEEISFFDLKVIHEHHGVVRRLLEAERQSAMSAVRPCPCCSTR